MSIKRKVKNAKVPSHHLLINCGQESEELVGLGYQEGDLIRLELQGGTKISYEEKLELVQASIGGYYRYE
jgi:hypothetical protein